MSYGPDLRGQYIDGATYVDHILRGAKPADLPVRFATKLELVINLKTARALGLAVPAGVLTRTDEVDEHQRGTGCWSYLETTTSLP